MKNECPIGSKLYETGFGFMSLKNCNGLYLCKLVTIRELSSQRNINFEYDYNQLITVYKNQVKMITANKYFDFGMKTIICRKESWRKMSLTI